MEKILMVKCLVLKNEMDYGNAKGAKTAVEAGLGISLILKYNEGSQTDCRHC